MTRLHRSVAALALLTASLVCQAKGPAVGDVPPDYVGRTLDGTDLKPSDFKGKAVVVSYWATWCPYCLKELPILNSIQKLAGKDAIQVIAVNTEERDVFRRVSRVLDKFELKLAYDPDDTARESYGVTGLPHMVIIGRDGKIEAIYSGYNESMLGEVAAAINRATGARPKN